MKMRILGTGSYVPERIVTNDDLAQIVETSDEWISTRTGIHERRISQGGGDQAAWRRRRPGEPWSSRG